MPLPASRRKMASRRAAVTMLAGLLALSACTEPPSWQKLLGLRVNEQYPNYKVMPTADGNLKVERPGMPTATVDVAGIELLCRRGPKDCSYATDQMLTSLQAQ